MSISRLLLIVSRQSCFRKYKPALLRLLVSFSAVVLTFILTPNMASAAATLEGEIFSSTDIRISSVRCNPILGEIYFSITGSASGPYVGQFVEQGFIDFDPITGIISSVEITFQVVDKSSGFKVDGTKTLNDSTKAFCRLNSERGSTEFGVAVQLSYTSTVDIGDATLDLKGEIDNKDGSLRSFSFSEVFHTSKILPPTPGKITGGGTILKTNDSGGVNFGFNAQSGANGMKGSGIIVDHSSGKKFKIIDVTYLGIAGTQAVFLGTAEVNGVVEEYRIDIEDLGEPGIGIDAFSIITDSYKAEGILTGGNIQIHK